MNLVRCCLTLAALLCARCLRLCISPFSKELKRIDVRGCARVSEHGLETCAKLLPECCVLSSTQAQMLS